MNKSVNAKNGLFHIVLHTPPIMPRNPLEPSILKQANALVAHAHPILEVAPNRLHHAIQDIINTLESYIQSDDEDWPSYRQNVPWEYVYSEFSSRLQLWRDNRVVSFQNDDTPKASMAERATATLADGGFESSVIEGDIGIHVAENANEAIAYIDTHFLGHPYSAIIGIDDSVVFTILDSTHYPSNKYSSTEYGTMMLSVEELHDTIIEVASANEQYAEHLKSIVGSE